MTPIKTTKIFLITTTTLIIAFDTTIYLTSGYEATISKIILDTYTYYPTIAFASGFICGHIFWPQQTTPPKTPPP